MSLTYKIKDLDDVLSSPNVNFEEGTLLIDIDRACMMEEKNIAQLYKDNPFLRNKIVTSTQKNSFEDSDKLISTRANLFDFIDKCQTLFKKVALITKRPEHEFEKIKLDINKQNIDIICYNNMLSKNNAQNHSSADSKTNEINETLYYIDTTSDAFNKLNKSNNSILFQIFPI